MHFHMETPKSMLSFSMQCICQELLGSPPAIWLGQCLHRSSRVVWGTALAFSEPG